MKYYKKIILLLFFAGTYVWGSQPQAPQLTVKLPVKKGVKRKNALAFPRASASGAQSIAEPFNIYTFLPHDLQNLIADYLPRIWNTFNSPILRIEKNGKKINPYRVAVIPGKKGSNRLLVGYEEDGIECRIGLCDMEFRGQRVGARLRADIPLGQSRIQAFARRGNQIIVYKPQRTYVLNKNLKRVVAMESPKYNGQEMRVDCEGQSKTVYIAADQQGVHAADTSDDLVLLDEDEDDETQIAAVAAVSLQGRPHIAVGGEYEANSQIKFVDLKTLQENPAELINLDSATLDDDCPLYLGQIRVGDASKLIVGQGQADTGVIDRVGVLDLATKKFDRIHRSTEQDKALVIAKILQFKDQSNNDQIALLYSNGKLRVWNSNLDPKVVALDCQVKRFKGGDLAAGRTPAGYPFIVKVALGEGDEDSHIQVVVQDKISAAEKFIRSLRERAHKKQKKDQNKLFRCGRRLFDDPSRGASSLQRRFAQLKQDIASNSTFSASTHTMARTMLLPTPSSASNSSASNELPRASRASIAARLSLAGLIK